MVPTNFEGGSFFVGGSNFVSTTVFTVFNVVQSPPPLSSPPVSFYKISVVGNFIEKKFILKILVLEIISKKIFLIFLFIRYDTTIIQLLFEKFSLSVCFCKLLMKLALVKSSSTSSFTSDHLKSIAFSSL